MNIKNTIAIIMLIGLASGASAQTYRWQDGRHSGLVSDALIAGATAADAYYTNRNMQTPGGQEYNPLAKPFVSTPGGVAAFFLLSAGVKIGTAHLLHHYGHHKLEFVERVWAIGDAASGAAFSATHGGKQ